MRALRKIIDDRRGLAVEMAFSTMLIVSALCMILLVVSALMQKNAVNDRTDIVAAAEVDCVAEDFAAEVSAEDFFQFDEAGFISDHSFFAGNLFFSSEGDDVTQKIYRLKVMHPVSDVSVTVEVRRFYDSVLKVWRAETVSWKHGV